MKRFFLAYICLLLCVSGNLPAQSLEKNIEQRLTDYFINYQTSYANIGTCKLDHFTVDHEHKYMPMIILVTSLLQKKTHRLFTAL